MKIYTTEEIRQLDRWAMESIPPLELMQRAGKVAFDCLRAEWPSAKKITVMAGSGNNAGDGYVLAHLAAGVGMAVQLLQVGDSLHFSEETKAAMLLAQSAGVSMVPYEVGVPLTGEVLVDAILGLGIHDTVKRQQSEAIDAMNASGLPILSIDVPSGLDSDSGSILGHAARATVTMTFIGVKRGMVTGDGVSVCGKIFCDDLSLPESLFHRIQETHQSIDPSAMKKQLPRRARNCHKRQFGQILVVGGNVGYAGAVQMSAMAAMRVGAGLVTIATHPMHAAMMDVALPEIMCRGIQKIKDLDDLIEEADVIVVGPGLGRDVWGIDLLKRVLAGEEPLVVDADALHFIAQNKIRRDNWVLTPHPGEAAVLLQETPDVIQANRYGAIKRLQSQYGGVCVLKGAGSLVLGESMTTICRDGNPGMATAGMGDVLTGVIAGLMGQGLSLEQAASLGVCLHAKAADAAAVNGERGLMATDLFDDLRRLVNIV